MDELQISGKRFISSRRIARENGYTSDYIGQLIRGGKIVGQKVGRAWYVDAASFDAYLGSEGATPVKEVAPSSAAETTIEAPISTSSVEPEPEVVEAPVEQVAPAPKTEEKKIEITPEAKTESILNTAEIKIAASEPQRIPLRINHKKVESPSSGLRYYTDDTSPLPEVNKRESVPHIIAMPKEKSQIEISEPRIVERKSSARKIGGLVTIGIVVLVVSATLSSAMTSNLSIEEGSTASVSYSLGW
jgi:hypothetical protein